MIMHHLWTTLFPTHASHSQPIALTHSTRVRTPFCANGIGFVVDQLRHCAVEGQMWFQCAWVGLVRRGEEERNHREIAHASPRSCPKTELKTLHGLMVMWGQTQLPCNIMPPHCGTCSGGLLPMPR
ncbi:hypothetical protein BGY98DRAFT_90630 [Russula aff. rugulosa BPL654]|nr:hypothetical protein BGY98DRAFT_90630 [Russula aff. rugulosa BPL654]